MSRQRAGGLPTVDRSHRAVAVVLPVYDQVARPLAAEADSKYSCEQVERPGFLGPKKHKDRDGLDA